MLPQTCINLLLFFFTGAMLAQTLYNVIKVHQNNKRYLTVQVVWAFSVTTNVLMLLSTDHKVEKS